MLRGLEGRQSTGAPPTCGVWPHRLGETITVAEVGAMRSLPAAAAMPDGTGPLALQTHTLFQGGLAELFTRAHTSAALGSSAFGP